jgi:HD-GYP domain-containing protein (c-di-GMP phosphodiesterase class II)
MARAALAELGLAALLHDIGLDATGDTALHGLHGAECLLQLGPVESVARPALVALEHHEEGAAASECDTATRIIQIADAYDTLTARGGNATPDRVLAFLLDDAAKHSDATLVKMLARALGMYPPGTVVRLAGGEVGVVLRANRDARLLDRPLVQVLRDASGRPCETVRTIDLAVRDERGFVAAILAAVAPEPAGAFSDVFLGSI